MPITDPDDLGEIVEQEPVDDLPADRGITDAAEADLDLASDRQQDDQAGAQAPQTNAQIDSIDSIDQLESQSAGITEPSDPPESQSLAVEVDLELSALIDRDINHDAVSDPDWINRSHASNTTNRAN
jgi:hypothetical protein